MMQAARIVGGMAGVMMGAAAMGQSAISNGGATPPPERGAPTSPPGQPEAAPPLDAVRPVVFSIEVRGEMNFNAEFKDSPGDVTVSRVGGTIGAAIPAGERGEVNVGFDYEYSNYEFSDDVALAPGVTGDPWRDIHREELTLRYSRQQSQQFSWFVGGSVGASGESGAELSDSVFGSVFGGVRYALSKTLVVGIGLGVRTQIEDNPLVVPLPMLNWQISEQWKLSSAGKPGLTLSYSPTEAMTFSLSGAYERRDFRLDDHGPIPGGVGRETRVPVVLGVAYTPTRQISVEAGVGVSFAQSYEVLNNGGDELGDEDVDPAGMVRVSVTYRF